RKQKHVAAAATVGQAAPKGSEQELEDRKQRADDSSKEHLGQMGIISQQEGDRFDSIQCPTQQSTGSVGSQIVAEQIGSEGEDDREPDQIDVERQKNDAQRQGAGGRGNGGAHGKAWTIAFWRCAPRRKLTE